MLLKVSFYGYLFLHPEDSVIRYDILSGNNKKYLLKSTVLDAKYENPTEDITVMVYQTLRECLEGIIGRFRNHEIELHVYEDLQPVLTLASPYEPLLGELEESIMKNKVSSFTIFGDIRKYKPQTAAREFLKKMGYFILSTKPPHVYVLDDFIREEYKLLQL
jgi:hypothetical protein